MDGVVTLLRPDQHNKFHKGLMKGIDVYMEKKEDISEKCKLSG